LAQACAVTLKSGLDKTVCPAVEEACWCQCHICKCFEGSVDFKWALALLQLTITSNSVGRLCSY